MQVSRRRFIVSSIAAIPALQVAAAAESRQVPELARQLGITMSSISRLVDADGKSLKYSLFEWIKILRDELDMTVLDLNSGVVESLEPEYLDRVRQAAADGGVFLTNMKINRSDVDVGNADAAVRRAAIDKCKEWIDASSRLGLRWARPLPLKSRPDYKAFVESYQELADYAAERKVQMIVENYGWMDSDPETTPKLLDDVGRNVAAAPDTGNWANNDVRYAALEKLFPRAVTCDFKAGKLGENGEHPPYDLKRCFTVGWNAGFRGPWCFEHANTDRRALFRELGLLRDMLRGWMAERG